jgi:hypothetical protein
MHVRWTRATKEGKSTIVARNRRARRGDSCDRSDNYNKVSTIMFKKHNDRNDSTFFAVHHRWGKLPLLVD